MSRGLKSGILSAALAALALGGCARSDRPEPGYAPLADRAESSSEALTVVPRLAPPEKVEFYFYLNSDQDIMGVRPDGNVENQGEILYDEIRALAEIENFGIHIYLDRGVALRGGDLLDSETYDKCAGKPALTATLGETDSTDPKNLVNLLESRCFLAAKRYVVLWSHGDGFRAQTDFDYHPGDRGFHVSKLLAAIPDGYAEAVLFDSCAMAHLEIAALLEKKSKWMVASQFELPNIGIRYGGLPETLAKSRETVAILGRLRADSEKAFREIRMNAPLVLVDLTKLAAVRAEFAKAYPAALAKLNGDFAAFRLSVLRRRDADLYFLFNKHAPDAGKILASALESGRGSLHFALPRTATDRDDDLEAVFAAAPEVFRIWSENFPNWADYARFRSPTSPSKGVSR